jgi:hypothetical protein
VQRAYSSGRPEDCTCNLIAFCTRRRRGDLEILHFFFWGFPKDKVQPLAVIMGKTEQSLPDGFCRLCTSGKVITIYEHLYGIWG